MTMVFPGFAIDYSINGKRMGGAFKHDLDLAVLDAVDFMSLELINSYDEDVRSIGVTVQPSGSLQSTDITDKVINLVKTKPEVGMGATMCLGSDRYPYTIIKITAKTVTVQRDNYRRIDRNGLSEDQTYQFIRYTNGETITLRKRKGKYGWWNNGIKFILGHRRAYIDPHF